MPRAQQPEPNEANRETTPPPPEPQRIGGAPHETINNLVFVLNLVNWNDSSLGQQLGTGRGQGKGGEEGEARLLLGMRT